MNNNIRHIMGISGGKDSAALALYLREKYPSIDFEYYFADTGKELQETYDYIRNIEGLIGKKVNFIEAHKSSHKDPFDHLLDKYNGYLPSSSSRWCTSQLKLEPFEEYIGQDKVISYVAIRGDEDREGYVSTKPNVQTIFPFRKSIWSIDVLQKLLHNDSIQNLIQIIDSIADKKTQNRFRELASRAQSKDYMFSQKVKDFLDLNISAFNKIVHAFLKTTEYPIGELPDFPLIDNTDNVDLAGVKRILFDSGLGLPPYTKEIDIEVNGRKGKYHRSRSGCFFCFYQRKIEWVWLYEQHPDLFQKAKAYEKDGYTWRQDLKLEDIENDEIRKKIKEDYLISLEKKPKSNSNLLIDILDDDSVNCVNCFI